MRYLFAIILPPIAVLSCGKIFSAILNCILCCCGLIPGIIHAILVVKSYNDKKNVKSIERAIMKSSAIAHQDAERIRNAMLNK